MHITKTKKIRKAIDNGEITCGVFRDLQKASDTVDHEILSKLEYYGICGVPLQWFKTFLTHNTHTFPSKVLYQKLTLMIMAYHKAWF